MPAGAPTKYNKEFNGQALKLCLLGATDIELADFFDVEEKTINNWKKKHPEFLQSIKEGKDQADSRVAESLYNRALGFSHSDTKFATYEGQITDSQEYTKHYPPDTTAAIFWLKNRQSSKWRDKTESKVTHNIGDEFLEAIQPTTGLPSDRNN